MTDTNDDPLMALEPHMKDAPVAPAHGIAAIALTLALKYHDIATCQDGTLYQQYKLEGKNLTPLHLDYVFETAIKIEAHLLGSSERIAQLVVDALTRGVEEEEKKATQPKTDEPGKDVVE